ncbi:MAG: RtcB family protein [candidate division Zixibacteria bacterium]|nr:RtcB family protein [candidate division Zixibacteria bacterium]
MKQMIKISDNIWEIPTSVKSGMRVPARILSSEKLIGGIDNGVIDQITNVACLPGIQKYALCMPDAHLGYGFPIGGVAAFDAQEGIISPGGIGFDINCGMRLISTNMTVEEVKPKLAEVIEELFNSVPSGVGTKGKIKLKTPDFNKLIAEGSKWCLDNGMATDDDVEHTETKGYIEGADIRAISGKAFNRGLNQIGTLGSGNHYLEIEYVRKGDIYNESVARTFGITSPQQIVIAIHCGSRGFGHQVATDYLRIFNQNSSKYGLNLKDRELAAAPITSADGEAYYAAMACAANVAFVNRQVITHFVKKSFEKVFNKTSEALGLKTIYDVAHNIARFEDYIIDGVPKRLLVHRKGATRSFGPNNADIPEVFRTVGQPVIVGGSMESGSALFVGTAYAESEYFGSTLHGSGRVMSRTKAKKLIRGDELQNNLKKQGILIRTGHIRGLAEEAGFAYKSIDDVSQAVDAIGISHLVARFVPLGNIKG